MTAQGGLDWPELMRLGLHGLRLEPRVFWGLTPAELAMMAGEVAGSPPLTRSRLAELIAAWPDGPEAARKGSGDDRG